MPIVMTLFAPGVKEEHDWDLYRRLIRPVVAMHLKQGEEDVTARYGVHDDWDENIKPLEIEIRMTAVEIEAFQFSFQVQDPWTRAIAFQRSLEGIAKQMHRELASAVPASLRFWVWIFTAAAGGYWSGPGTAEEHQDDFDHYGDR